MSNVKKHNGNEGQEDEPNVPLEFIEREQNIKEQEIELKYQELQIQRQQNEPRKL